MAKKRLINIDKLDFRVTAQFETEEGVVTISKSDKYDVVFTNLVRYEYDLRISENRYLWKNRCYYNSTQLLGAMNRKNDK